ITISNTLSRREETRSLLADDPMGNTLQFHNGTNLYFGVELSETNILSYSLPPKIPGAFDVRFAGDMKAIGDIGVIELTHSSPMIRLSYDATIIGENWVLVDKENDEEYALTGAGELQISGAVHSLELRRSSSSAIPETFALHQNFPNPFNPVTTLSYGLAKGSDVRFAIFDMLGNEVATLVNSHQQAGFKSVQWDGTDSMGRAVSAGVYLYRIEAEEFVETKKMVLLK
ncbi:uncharacterized protein METZ01_LOCUS420345, partial [marine metagenome]